MIGLGMATTASLMNLTRPGDSLRVGDRSLLLIAGDPNSDVYVDVTFPTGATTHSKFGTTNASGEFTSQQDYTAEHLGHWSMTWSVNGQLAPTMEIDILPAVQVAEHIEPDLTVMTTSTLSSIPTWVWIAGAAAIAWYAFGKKA